MSPKSDTKSWSNLYLMQYYQYISVMDIRLEKTDVMYLALSGYCYLEFLMCLCTNKQDNKHEAGYVSVALQ